MNTVISYLKQPSTWRGIIAVAAAFGLSLNPEQAAAIVAAAVAAVGVLEVFRNENPPEK